MIAKGIAIAIVLLLLIVAIYIADMVVTISSVCFFVLCLFLLAIHKGD